MKYLELAETLLPKIIEWRRHIHQNAELSFEEYETQRFVCEVLEHNKISFSRIAGTGILAKLEGENPTEPIVLRADMDALPIQEKSGVDFACTTGVMHACGHDIHTASLLGALVLLKSTGCKRTVWGLFQPGEEVHPGGASIVLNEGVFDGVAPLCFIGQHVSPELEVGQFGFRPGKFMASTDEVHITMRGRGGHGAMPHLLADPVVATASMIMSMQSVVSRGADAQIPSVLSFGRVIADGATNIIPDEVYVEGTLRTMDENWRAEAKRRIVRVAQSTAEAYGTQVEVDIKDGYPCVYNDIELTEKAMAECVAGFGEEAMQKIPRRMTAEDFGFYADRYPSVFYRLGVGASAPLHNAGFRPDERALAYGSAMMAMLAEKILD